MSITISLRYGAAELKRLYNRNLGFALIISVGVHLALICLYLIATTPGGAVEDKDRGHSGPIRLEPRVTPEKPKVPQVDIPFDPGPVGPTVSTSGKEVAGDFKAVPDEMVNDDVAPSDFATWRTMRSAVSTGSVRCW